MIDAEKVIRGLQDIKTYLASQAEEAEKVGNDLAKEGHIESQKDIIDAITLIKCGQPIKGHWEVRKRQRTYTGTPYIKYRCSVCGEWVDQYENSAFCPFCGADMRGEQDEKGNH